MKKLIDVVAIGIIVVLVAAFVIMFSSLFLSILAVGLCAAVGGWMLGVPITITTTVKQLNGEKVKEVARYRWFSRIS